MSYLTVYLGSDHVIQQPGFEYQKNSLSVSSDPADAIRVACRRSAVGVLNSYQIDLDSVSVKTPGQQVLNGFDAFDVLLSDDPTDSRMILCSNRALKRLRFVGASFVRQ